MQNPDDVSQIPTYTGDLFSPEALKFPFEHYAYIRNLGPIVRLDKLDVYAISRFDDVQAALRRSDVLISGKGVGFNDFINAEAPEPRTIHSDGARHRRLRGVLGKPLMPAALREHRDMLRALIGQRIVDLINVPEFDAVATIAQCLPLEAISYLVGLPDSGRQEMLRWATAGFNAVAPLENDGAPDAEVMASLEVLREAAGFFLSVDPAELRPGSWAAMLFDAKQAGKLTVGEARAAISGLVLPSLDTTIFAKGNLLYNLVD